MHCNLFKIFKQNHLKYGLKVNFLYPLKNFFEKNPKFEKEVH